MKTIDGVRLWGDMDEGAFAQAVRCSKVGNVKATALMGDKHKGYSMPIGGVIAYRDEVSPSGVGYDISCGLKAVRTNASLADVRASLGAILDDINRQIAFGLGRKNPTPIEHDLFDDPAWQDQKNLASMRDNAAQQLGTVGSGNHFVDLLEEPETGALWVACHFGSRGFGHGVASGFLNLAVGRDFHDKAPGETMDQDPTILSLSTALGEDYWQAMTLAGRYAFAGRDFVIQQVLGILGAQATYTVHNAHNFAWKETHEGEEVVVVRKGATPAFPGQEGFVGGSMADIAVVIAGVDSEENRLSLSSAMHGAGRIMSRTQAKGKWKKGVQKSKGLITRQMMSEATKEFGVLVRGGEVDESPHVYRNLQGVLDAHAGSIEIRHTLRPIGVVMAGADVVDPFKD